MLTIVDVCNKRITFYDSLHNDGTVFMLQILDYLNKESNARLGKSIDEWSWSMSSATHFPQQKNSYDCGVYVCKFAKQLFSNEWDILPMSVIRRQIAAKITESK